VVQKKFNYPMDADLDKCRNWVLHMAGSSLWNFKSMLTRDWLKWGKNPCSKYTMIKDHQWEAFKKNEIDRRSEGKEHQVQCAREDELAAPPIGHDWVCR
jgi:hypothetical protein